VLAVTIGVVVPTTGPPVNDDVVVPGCTPVTRVVVVGGVAGRVHCI
jgi:hypothetical protein